MADPYAGFADHPTDPYARFKLEVANLYVDCDRTDGATSPAIVDATNWFRRQRA